MLIKKNLFKFSTVLIFGLLNFGSAFRLRTNSYHTTSFLREINVVNEYSEGVFKRLISLALVAPFCFVSPALAEQSLQEQLKVVQALQLQQQQESLDSQQQSVVKRGASYEAGELLAKGVVTLLPDSRFDPSQYPLGLPDAVTLDPGLGDEKATLYLTAVGREGPPVAAKKLSLKGVSFPYLFEITTQDLLFPYTPEAWRKTSASGDTIAVTCILDTDGVLTTPSKSDRFGFAISDPVALSGSFQRTEAKVAVSMKSDGRPYTQEELEVLGRLDRELDKSTSTTTSTSPSVSPSVSLSK
mmetsp:Transcript_38135/g.38826  ORF Transcript_38135/g.38826 Transcript_38135/m.38826 type:complete len:299 (-) Transcript_38135:383-1279(-)